MNPNSQNGAVVRDRETFETACHRWAVVVGTWTLRGHGTRDDFVQRFTSELREEYVLSGYRSGSDDDALRSVESFVQSVVAPAMGEQR